MLVGVWPMVGASARGLVFGCRGSVVACCGSAVLQLVAEAFLRRPLHGERGALRPRLGGFKQLVDLATMADHADFERASSRVRAVHAVVAMQRECKLSSRPRCTSPKASRSDSTSRLAST